MPKEIVLMKTAAGLVPATPKDQALYDKWKLGQGLRVQVTQMDERSLRHHRLYFGGLLELALDYWEPQGGLLQPMEENAARQYAKWLDPRTNGAGTATVEHFLEDWVHSRADKVPALEKDIDALHLWVKEKAGYFKPVLTPDGVRKMPVSISFKRMPQSEFNDFYRAAFSVCWQFILSRTFNNEQEAQTAVNELLRMG